MNSSRLAGLLLCCLLASPAALAQQPDDGDANGQPGGSGRHHGPASHDQDAAKLPQPKPPPRQRLDAGALLCHTEAQLRQHQAAVVARISGGDAPEPRGCHIVREMVPVSVLERHGSAVTEVRLHTTPEEVGWTDSVVRDLEVPYPPDLHR
jgi:hypothetical protein